MNKFKIILASFISFRSMLHFVLVAGVAFGATNESPRCCCSYDERSDVCTVQLPCGYELKCTKRDAMLGGIIGLSCGSFSCCTSFCAAYTAGMSSTGALMIEAPTGCCVGACCTCGAVCACNNTKIRPVNNPVEAITPGTPNNLEPYVVGRPVQAQMVMAGARSIQPSESQNQVQIPG